MPSVYSKKTAGVADRSGRPSVPPAVRSRKSNRYITLPPLALHSSDVLDSVQPWPLQAFWPLHELVALLQALWPLQALTPPHLMPSAWAAVAKAEAAKIEAAVAMMVRLVMTSSLLISNAGRPASLLRAALGPRSAKGAQSLLKAGDDPMSMAAV